jgi:hypothetical protein
MWCPVHPNSWDQLGVLPELDMWTIAKMKDHRTKIIRENLKDAKDISGIVDFPLWDFIEPSHFGFPQLHVEIGLVNNVLDSFYDFVEEQV